MNTWQVARQAQYLVRSRSWTGSSTTVFADASVIISSAVQFSAIEQMRMPVALIRVLSMDVDPEHREEPDLVQQDFGVSLVTAVASDAHGQAAMVGSNRFGQTDSRGRGLLEVEEELFGAVEELNTIDGVVIQLVASGAPEAIQSDALGYVVARDYRFSAWVTMDRFYHPIINLREC